MRGPLILIALTTMLGCPDRSMDRARGLEQEGKFKEAGDLYFRAASREPANLNAWDGAIENWCRKEVNVDKCMKVLDTEMDLLGNLERHHHVLSEVLEQRARARIDKGMAEAGLADLVRAEKAGPGRASVYVARAKALMMLGRAKDALDALYKARKIDPHNEEANALFRDIPKDLPQSDGFGGDAILPNPRPKRTGSSR